MVTGEERREDRRRLYREALRLWEAENPIKTLKLQALLLTNGLLLAAFFALLGDAEGVGAGRAGPPGLALFMFWADVIWLHSIGRTVAYQKLRKAQLEEIRAEDPGDPLLGLHEPPARQVPWWGRVGSSRYLIGSPATLAVLWLFLFGWGLWR